MKLVSYIFIGLLIFISSIKGVTSQGPNEDFEDLVNRFMQWRFYETPEFATSTGYHQHDHRLSEFTEEAFERQKYAADEFLLEAHNIPGGQLTYEHGISLKVLEKLLEHFISGYKFRIHSVYNNISPFANPLTLWGGTASSMKFETVNDHMVYITRLQESAVQIRNITSLLKVAVETRTTMTELSIIGYLELLEEELAKPLDETKWYFPDMNSIDDYNDTIKDYLTSTILEIISQEVKPAYEIHLNFMQTEYLPNTRVNIGASSLPDGLAYYQECLDWHLSIHMTPQEAHELGLSEVARIHVEMQEIMDEEGFEGDSLSEFIKYLFDDPNNFYQGETADDDMLQDYEDIIKEAHEKLPLVLRYVPEHPILVMPALNPAYPDGMYSAPPLDLSEPGIFYANVFDVHTKPKFNMRALTLHEAEPGHHTENVFLRQQDWPLFRLITDSRNYASVPFHWLFHTSYGEGWALYAESLGEDMGMYTTNLDRFGKLNFEIWRAVRLVVDTGMHALNWTKDEALTYMKENTALSNSSAENEINRYITHPGQACAFKVGELTIQRLRREARHELGDLFDIRDFNHEVLSLGPAPLSIVEDHIHDWIGEVKENNPISRANKLGPMFRLLMISGFMQVMIVSTIAS